MDQRADEPLGRLVERVEQVDAAARAVDRLVHAVEDALDLLIQLGAVGDEQDAGVRLVLANPLGQPHHGERFARPLGVPDDAALAPLHALLRGLDAEVLVRSAGLLNASVEHDEVVDDLQQPVLGSEEHEGLVERALNAGEFSVDPCPCGRVDV